MAIRSGPWQSKNDHDFILRALRSGRRVDGRKPGEMRLLRMVFARAEGEASAEIQLGRTRVLGVVTGEVVPPFPDRPNEGLLQFNVDIGPMAAANLGERHSPLSVEIARMLEVGVKDSQSLDMEALCIIGGEKVWQLRCDVHVLDHGGNLIDASILATMAALRHFRRPEVTIDGPKVVVHHTDDKEPHPLPLHHVPICVTFAIFEETSEDILNRRLSSSRSNSRSNSSAKQKSDAGSSGGVMSYSVMQLTSVDPTEAEEEVMKGKITFALTAQKEMCALHKNGGVAMTPESIFSCARLAAVKVGEMHRVLDEALAGADAKATLDRQNRLRGKNSRVGAGGREPVPGTARGRRSAKIPGTRSTPFVAEKVPMPVDPEALKVKHLEYDDLHVTQGIREEGLRGGGNRGGRGMDIEDARKTDLFAKMAAAAGMAAASIAGEDEKNRSGTSAAAAEASTPRDRRSNGAGTGRRTPKASARSGGALEEEEENEFAQMVKATRERSAANGASNGGIPQPSPASAAAAAPPTTMDVDSEEEEETVTLEGEFKGVQGGKVEEEKRAAVKGGGAGAGATQKDGVTGGGDKKGDEDDDLLSAVKSVKARSRGKGQGKGKAKSKRGKV